MIRRLLATLAVAALLVACGSGDSDDTTTTQTPDATGALSGEIVVFAAASLQESFEAIGAAFTAANPDAKVTFNFGPSSGLATQITEGAPADVFASASGATMETVVTAGLAASPTKFAANTLTIAAPADNPAAVAGLADLAKPEVKVAVCQVEVPCGALAQKLFADNALAVTPVTYEVDVKAVLAKVQLGEVDAGLVYVTDARAAGDGVTEVEIPADSNVSTTYPIAALTDAPNAPVADAFVAYVLSPAGQEELGAAGFAAP